MTWAKSSVNFCDKVLAIDVLGVISKKRASAREPRRRAAVDYVGALLDPRPSSAGVLDGTSEQVVEAIDAGENLLS